jgi:hypothetical protein
MDDPIRLIEDSGGTVDKGSLMQLPDGSACFTASFPLPKDHWLYAVGLGEPPAPWRVGEGALRSEWAAKITAAARYAIRGATMSGQESDFDPDAMVQNMIVGMLGYWTHDGFSHLDSPTEEGETG